MDDVRFHSFLVQSHPVPLVRSYISLHCSSPFRHHCLLHFPSSWCVIWLVVTCLDSGVGPVFVPDLEHLYHVRHVHFHTTRRRPTCSIIGDAWPTVSTFLGFQHDLQLGFGFHMERIQPRKTQNVLGYPKHSLPLSRLDIIQSSMLWIAISTWHWRSSPAQWQKHRLPGTFGLTFVQKHNWARLPTNDYWHA